MWEWWLRSVLGLSLLADDIEKLRGRRIRIFPDVDAAGQNAAARIGQAIATLAAEVQIFDLARLHRDDGVASERFVRRDADRL